MLHLYKKLKNSCRDYLTYLGLLIVTVHCHLMCSDHSQQMIVLFSYNCNHLNCDEC